ncbi:3-phosphoshikimate 1-carboxyvinyltransferase [Bacteroidia bacterium]|nr:3-phosphoshikimate 1-carboxyvinyltransferase [Bacteroidia bacterium]
MKLYFPVKTLNLTANLPASKSLSNRALILQALAESAVEIRNLSDADDVKMLQNALHSGVAEINIGNSGTAMRFLTAFFAQTAGEKILTGSARMKQRPVGILVDALKTLGAKIAYLENEGFPPLKIIGKPLSGGEVALDGGVSSQFASALMMIAPKMKNGLKIRLQRAVVSQPYIEMTAKIMRHFGVFVHFDGKFIEIPPQKFVPQPLEIENDWTAASYWYEMLAVAGDGEVFLPNLTKNSWQGDKIVAEIFEKYFNIKTEYLPNGISIKTTKNEQRKKIVNCQLLMSNYPDLAQTLAVTCLLRTVPFRFTGLETLKIKETDRLAALTAEARKIGFVLKTENENTLAWNGETCAKPDKIVISTHNDHRMAMAFAPVALHFPVEIENPETAAKSYPNFWEEILAPGRKIIYTVIGNN